MQGKVVGRTVDISSKLRHGVVDLNDLGPVGPLTGLEAGLRTIGLVMD